MRHVSGVARFPRLVMLWVAYIPIAAIVNNTFFNIDPHA